MCQMIPAMCSLVRPSQRRFLGSHCHAFRTLIECIGESSHLHSTRATNNLLNDHHHRCRVSLFRRTNHQRRFMGSGGGTRGARGHGWWVNYREGKGGRHLQGEYFDRSLGDLQVWNDAVFSLGSQLAFMDIKIEPMVVSDAVVGDATSKEESTTTYRLMLELATAVLPLATENFVKLLQSPPGVGYTSSTLHRVEKKVGLMGGLVWNQHHPSLDSNDRRMNKSAPVGKCHEDLRMPTSWTNMDVSSERMVLSHVPGILTMVSPRVHEIDSRFLLCSQYSPHLDGKAIAIGRLADDESFQIVQNWEQSLITLKGRPTSVVLRIVKCGLLQENDSSQGNVVTDEPEGLLAS
jgi:cyclophilin family peptidyl-prolyl cis-trans isomerase